jgi:hypothetical protein
MVFPRTYSIDSHTIRKNRGCFGKGIYTLCVDKVFLTMEVVTESSNFLEECVISEETFGAEGDSHLIKDIYVIVDGSVIFHKSYSKTSKEPALVSGFIGAIASFAREITSTGVLKKVVIPPVKFVASQVMERPQVIVALLLSDRFPDSLSEELLESISDIILNKYMSQLIDSRGEDLSVEISKEVHETVVATIRKYIANKSPRTK